MLGAPLLQAMSGFTLEVDDHEIVAGDQYLTEVIVAVNADFLAFRRCRGTSCQALEHPIAQRQHGVGFLAIGARKLFQTGLSPLERTARLVERPLSVAVQVGAG